VKKEGALKRILSLLVIVLIVLISVGGIYVKDKNIMKNIIPDYILGMDLETNTLIKLEVSKPEEDSSEDTNDESETESSENSTTEEKDAVEGEENNSEKTEENPENKENAENKENSENKEEGQPAENIYTAENYKKSKEIIEKRLKACGINQYTARVDKNTGIIILEVSNNVNVDMLRNTFVVGNAELKISETNEVLADFNNIKKITLTTESGTLKADLEFSKEAQNKFKELKNTYQIPTDENGKVKDNTVVLSIDGSQLFTWEEQDFLNQASNGSVLLNYFRMEYKTLIEEEIKSINAFLEYGKLPVQYTVTYSNDIHTNITKTAIISVIAVVLVIMLAYLIVKYKAKGIMAWSTILGYLSLVLLALRYTKVQISIAAIVAIISIAIIQFIYLVKLLSNKKVNSKVFNTETLEFSKMIIPTFIMSMIIAFANITEISGFGMVIFWGIVLFEIFNNIITRAILTNGKNK